MYFSRCFHEVKKEKKLLKPLLCQKILGKVIAITASSFFHRQRLVWRSLEATLRVPESVKNMTFNTLSEV